MFSMKLLLHVSAAAVVLLAGSVKADSLPMDRIDEVLRHGSAVGFTLYDEIEAKSRERVEFEGWLDDETHAKVVVSLPDGSVLEDARKRLITGAWGMSEDDVRHALDLAAAHGMVEFEEIDIDKQGVIEVEGRDALGRELEVYVRQGSNELLRLERD